MADEAPNFLIEDARIMFRNFSGKEGKYNDEGERSFSVILPPDLADRLQKDNWNVRALSSREEGEPDVPYLSVKVSYKNRPPQVTLINGAGGRTYLDEAAVGMLDGIDIKNVDLICRGYQWEVNGKVGVKAYLQTMFVTIEEDALQRKYAEYDDATSHRN